MDIPTYYVFVILTWVLNGLFCVGLMVFLAKNGRRIGWVLVGIVVLPTLSFVYAYLFQDFWMLPNFMSACIPIIAGAYRRVGDLYPTSTYEKFMKTNFLIIALLYVLSLSAIHIGYAAVNYDASRFDSYWYIILIVLFFPTAGIGAVVNNRRRHYRLYPKFYESMGDVPTERYLYYAKNVTMGSLVALIGVGLSALFYIGRDVLTLPGIETIGICCFVVSFATIVLAFIGMVSAKGNLKKYSEESSYMEKFKEFKEQEKGQGPVKWHDL